jgi:hypothetical protein
MMAREWQGGGASSGGSLNGGHLCVDHHDVVPDVGTTVVRGLVPAPATHRIASGLSDAKCAARCAHITLTLCMHAQHRARAMAVTHLPIRMEATLDASLPGLWPFASIRYHSRPCVSTARAAFSILWLLSARIPLPSCPQRRSECVRVMCVCVYGRGRAVEVVRHDVKALPPRDLARRGCS